MEIQYYLEERDITIAASPDQVDLCADTGQVFKLSRATIEKALDMMNVASQHTNQADHDNLPCSGCGSVDGKHPHWCRHSL